MTLGFSQSWAVSLDGRRVAGLNGSQILVRDAGSGEQLFSIPHPMGLGCRIGFSPDGRMLAGELSREAAPGYRHWVTVLELASGHELCRFPCTDSPQYTAFAPDGRTLAAGVGRNRIQLWDLALSKEVATFQGHDAWVSALAFAPDGRRLASGLMDTSVLVWEVPPTAPLPVSEPVSPLRLAEWWADLAGNNPARAYEACCKLTAAGDRTVGFLADRLRPPAVDQARIRALIAELESDDFTVREAASSALRQMRPQAESELRRALAASRSAEARRRLSALVEGPLPAESVRDIRAVMVLEWISSAEALRTLQRLAAGDPHWAPTAEAMASAERLGAKSKPGR